MVLEGQFTVVSRHSESVNTYPPQRGIAILGVCGLTPVGLELARPPARPPAARPQATVCVPKRDMGAHGRPWAPHGRPMGAPWAPHVLFLHGKTTKNIKNCLNGVEVAPFGLSLGRNGATGGAEPLGLLPRPKTAPTGP